MGLLRGSTHEMHLSGEAHHVSIHGDSAGACVPALL